MAPKDVHILILRTCEDGTLLGKRDFAGVLRLRLVRGRPPWIICVAPWNHKSPCERTAGRAESEEKVTGGQAQATVLLAGGDGGAAGQGTQVPAEPGKGRVEPRSPPGTQPASTTTAEPVRLGFLTSRTMRKIYLLLEATKLVTVFTAALGS